MDSLTQALSTVVIQIVIVFAVLMLISLSVLLLKLFSGEKKEQIEASVPEVPADVTEDAVPAMPETEEIDARIVAVIMASIAASVQSSGEGFIVRSIRRVDSWNDTARKEKFSRR